MRTELLDQRVLKQAALPKAKQWLEWVKYHHDNLPAFTGWQRGLRDVAVELHHHIASSARRLRRNPTWDISGTMVEDTEPLEDRALRLLAKFNSINRRDVPTRFDPLMDCIFGAIRQQVRLGREIDVMQKAGALNIELQVDQVNTAVVEQ